MTQSVTNTLNNIEQMLSCKEPTKKVAESVDSAMDKGTDFEKVFDSTLSKKTSTIAEVKDKASTEDMTLLSADFKEILEKATDEANVETSLDLTLAIDITEIITQLKEAVENATEIIEENSDVTMTETTDELATGLNELEVEVEETDEIPTIQNSDEEQQLSFDQVLVYAEKANTANSTELVQNNIKTLSEEVSDFSKKSDSLGAKDTALFETIDTAEIVDMVENIPDEVVAVKPTNETTESSIQDLNVDEEILKELKIESFSAETDTAGGETLMQNQTPEEHAVKAMISTEVEAFELKIDSTQSLQASQQIQTKTAEVNPSRIIEQVSKQMNALQNGGKVNIVLNPESLGKVNIQLLSTKDGLTAQFTVTTQEARDILTKGLDGLKESLGTHGVAVDNVSVKVADSQKSEQNNDWTEQEGSRGGNKGQGQPNREEKEKGLFEKMMAQTKEKENGNV